MSKADKAGSSQKSPKESTTALGRFIRERRFELGLAQRKLARRAWGRPEFQGIVCRIERGNIRQPTPKTLRRLALALGVQVSELKKVAVSKEEYLTPSLTALGRLIRSLRQGGGMTQKELSERSGVSPGTIRRLEHQGESVRTSTAKQIAKTLGCDVRLFREFLLMRKERQTESPLGGLLRKRRHELLMTQPQLAKKLGVTRQTVSLIELGEINLTRSGDKKISKLAEALKLDPLQLKELVPAPLP